MQSLQSPARAGASSIEFSLLSEVPGIFRGYIWQNMTVVIWYSATTLESLVVYEQSCALARERCPNGLSGIHIIKSGRQLPSSEARDAMNEINNKYLDMVAALAIVIEGGGFWASAVRGMITALNMRLFKPRTFEQRIHATLEEAMEWLPAEHQRRTGVHVSPDALIAAVRLIAREP